MQVPASGPSSLPGRRSRAATDHVLLRGHGVRVVPAGHVHVLGVVVARVGSGTSWRRRWEIVSSPSMNSAPRGWRSGGLQGSSAVELGSSRLMSASACSAGSSWVSPQSPSLSWVMPPPCPVRGRRTRPGARGRDAPPGTRTARTSHASQPTSTTTTPTHTNPAQPSQEAASSTMLQHRRAGSRKHRHGISGWRYPGWRGDFYPRGPAPAARARVRRRAADLHRDQRLVLLAAAARRRTPRGATQTPDGLRVLGQGRPRSSPTSSGCATSRRRWPTSSPPACSRSGPARARCCGSCPRTWPSTPTCSTPSWACSRAPRREAAALAAQHDDKVPEDRALDHGATTTGRCGTRWSSAARRSRRPRPSRCCASTASPGASPTRPAAGRRSTRTPRLRYVRLHGDQELYASGYTTAALDEWAEKVPGLGGGAGRLRLLRQRRQGFAPHDAIALAELLGV